MKGLFLSIIFFTSLSLAAQDKNKILVRNAGIVNGKHTISVKWYSPDIYYPEGVNIYRKDNKSDWRKLNLTPVKMLDSLPQAEYERDAEFYYYVPLVKDSRKEDLKGLLLFQVLYKSWESEAYARFLGIQYDDETIEAGRTYTYKVNKIDKGTEKLIALSNSIIAGPQIADEPVKDITYKADTNKVKIKWKPEEQRFFGVLIYRSQDNKHWAKIRNRPLVISKYRDTLGNLRYPEIFAIDDTLEEGIYYYQLAGLDFFGKETKRSESYKIEVKDLVPPVAPEELNDSINNLNVFLTWKNSLSEDIVGINVYRSIKSNGPFIKINPTLLTPSTNVYRDKVYKPGPYYYYVASVDKAGNEGKSRPKFSEVHDIIAPSKPLGLMVKADTGRIILSWLPNKEADLMGYRIYRTANKNDKNNFVLINTNPIKGTKFIDSLPVSAKNKFLYKIIAIDTSYNKSVESEIVSVSMPDIMPPVKPVIKSIRNDNDAISITWIANKDADLKGYIVYRGSDNESYHKINTSEIPASQSQFIDRTVESGIKYFYYLVAIDSAGNQSQPSNIQLAFNNYNTLKSPPENIKFKYREDKKDLYISWSMSNKKDVLGYVIYRKQKESDDFSPYSEQVTSNEFYDKDIKAGTTYFYEIRAYDNMGNSASSEVKKITIKNKQYISK